MTHLYPWELQKCRKPDCWRKVKKGADYCCAPCTAAAAGRYEIHAHTEPCDQRAADRGEYGLDEMVPPR